MLRRKATVAFAMTILTFTILQGLTASPVLSRDPPAWAKEIMKNTTISGLNRPEEGERQEIRYLGKGAWEEEVNDVWYFLVYRLLRWEGSGWQKDLQAHIELAKVGDGVYRMEIYHSWDTLVVDMPYDYTVLFEEKLAIVLQFEADL